MLKKPLALAAMAIATTTTLLPTEASAGDPGLGALLGAAVGAAIGHGVNGHDGAIVGGVLGAVTGASIAAGSGGYYAPAPVVVRPRPVVVYRAAPYPPAYAPVVVARPHHWRHGGRHEGRGPRWR
jgi:hypothetical protein